MPEFTRMTLATGQEIRAQVSQGRNDEVIVRVVFASLEAELPPNSELDVVVFPGEDLADSARFSEFVSAKGIVQSPSTILVTICARRGLVRNGIVDVWVTSKVTGLSWEPYSVEFWVQDQRTVPRLATIALSLIFAAVATSMVWFVGLRLTPQSSSAMSTLVLPASATRPEATRTRRRWSWNRTRYLVAAALIVGLFALGYLQWQAIDDDLLWGGSSSEILETALTNLFQFWAVLQSLTVLNVKLVPTMRRVASAVVEGDAR